ncbi:hypothetical protein GIB67_007141 [Kingdonia uniflora]|uniref:Uncharacterized protein n=1 Tax=Kingdonia uniflora TaxID=39325 RepID=A0A7J7MLL3_9MAGN|nr:hypothetical protein GIB67_007141 [Kingdonia uniflora]
MEGVFSLIMVVYLHPLLVDLAHRHRCPYIYHHLHFSSTSPTFASKSLPSPSMQHFHNHKQTSP